MSKKTTKLCHLLFDSIQDIGVDATRQVVHIFTTLVGKCDEKKGTKLQEFCNQVIDRIEGLNKVKDDQLKQKDMEIAEIKKQLDLARSQLEGTQKELGEITK